MGARDLLAQIPALSEAELWDLLAEEKRGQARLYLMQRIYHRASKLRHAREVSEMAQLAVERINA